MLIQNPLNSSEWSFPILECFHIAGFAVAIGTVAIVDFRLLGLAMRHQTPAQLTKETSLLTIISLIIAVFSGLLIFSTDPDKYYLNLAFLFKIACLLPAIGFHYTIHRKVVFSGASLGASILVACVSLALWVSVIFGGIFIAFLSLELNFN
jgi:hypothetical protein